MFDFGHEGYETTKQLLNDAKISFFGTEGKDFKLTKDNNKLVFNGFCCYSSGPLRCVSYGQYGVNEYNLGTAQKVLLDNANNGYLDVFCVHAGKEHVNYPSYDTINAARLLAEKCPVLYIGHHPHVAQGIERIKDSLIAYSLGNFCFDNVYSSVSDKPLIELSENNRNTFILETIIENNKLKDYKVIPVYIGKERMIVGNGVTMEMIQEYTDAICQMPKTEYEQMRNRLLKKYLDERKQMRDLSWYLKRLRPRYFKMIINSKRNHRKYNEAISKYLQQ